MLDVGAKRVGEIGQFVHERDPCRQHRIGRVLGQLRGANIHHQHTLVIALERRVDRTQQADRPLVVGADDHPVRPHEILDRRAFLQELGVRCNREPKLNAAPRKLGGNRLPHTIRGAYRHCRLVDDNLGLDHAATDVACGRDDVLHIGGPIFVGRRADRDELQGSMGDRRVDIGGESQPATGDVAPDHLLQTWLVYRNSAALEGLDLAGIDVQTHHVVADLGEAGSGDETDIAGPDHRYLQAGTFVSAPIEVLMASSAASGSEAPVIGRPITR